MAARKVTYNIPGIGNLTANLFDYTQQVYDFLDHYGHILRFRTINQLGRLRDVYQGAHHNRYEYVFLQLSLISELCSNKKSELGLSGERRFCGKISDDGPYPSTGELLQCLVLLNNMGYLEGTFSTSRAWLSLLKENRDVFNFFKNGLDKDDWFRFEKCIDGYEYGKFNIFMALFQLQRYKRKGKNVVEFASSLLRKSLSSERSDIHLVQFKKLYSSIRQLSFITLDSLYAPVPFSLDLSSILLNFEELLESLFIKNTTYRIALGNLEQVLQDSVYMASDACINTGRASDEKITELRSQVERVNGITDLAKIVCPDQESGNFNLGVKELDWIREKKIIQEYRLTANDRDNLPYPLTDEVKWEIELKKRLGVSRSQVGILTNFKKSIVKLAIGLTTTDNAQSLRAALKVTNELIKFKDSMPQTPFNLDGKNEELLLSFLLKAIFGWEKKFILENKNRIDSAIFVSNGRVSTIEKIDKYMESARKYLNNDEIFEVEKTRDLVEHNNYSGLTIVFVGGTKLFDEGDNQGSAEYDGLIIHPTKDPREFFGYILEAKNYNNGATDAEQQLRERVEPHLIQPIECVINRLNNRAAYAEVKLQRP
ncbi:MAG: hypothetical protein GYB31_00510 [Bacteroidetes bacterium]|nr:hypothetical protein [Bacteroidota bacterium]